MVWVPCEKLADLLQQHPQRTVLVEGFTDSTGSAAHNQKLSERRAISVRSSLAGDGSWSRRVSPFGALVSRIRWPVTQRLKIAN
jgi:outer membrane protein OmpA-like peptidoglycan-associated protein